MARSLRSPVRHLVVILGDQLDPKSAALDGLDVQYDAVWMAEVAEEIEILPPRPLARADSSSQSQVSRLAP